MTVREARGGTLILGGGFGGAYVARLLGSATVVSPESSLLYTPLLPEVAAGAIEPRHAFVPLRMMCPRAELLRGHASALDQTARTVTVETETGPVVVSYWRLVIALGSTPRMPPIPGLGVHALTFKDMSDAVHLRNHVLRRLDLAESDPRQAARQLTFVFVGAGYAGVEALAETRQLVQDALPHYPALRGVRQRWVLVDAAPRILAEVPDRLSDYTSGLLQQDGVEILTSSTASPRSTASVGHAGHRPAHRHRDRGVGGGRQRAPAGPRLGSPARRARTGRRRLLAPGPGSPGHLGAGGLRGGAQRGDAGAVRPAHVPACRPPGPRARRLDRR